MLSGDSEAETKEIEEDSSSGAVSDVMPEYCYLFGIAILSGETGTREIERTMNNIIHVVYCLMYVCMCVCICVYTYCDT